MVRVAGVQDGHTILVERSGKTEAIALAGVEIIDEARARDLLVWTLNESWVMVDDGLVYRSPDALFVNRELVLRGYARATQRGIAPESHLNVTYLGTLDLPRVNAPGSGSGSDTRRRSPAPPSRRAPRPSSPAHSPRPRASRPAPTSAP